MKDLIIEEFHKGIGPSPHLGHGDMRNLDISTIPGVARLNNILAKVSSTTVTNLVQWFRVNPDSPSQVFALDKGGQLYKSTDSGATWATVTGETAGGTGQGMEILDGYVIVARATALDAYNISGDSWTNSWQTIDSDTDWHPMVRSKSDGIVYGGAGQYVFSISVTGTFDPGNGGTFTFTQQALDLPNNYRIKCLEDLGDDLMIGTWQGTNVYDLRIADIFPWDRSSPSFRKPVSLSTNGVHGMVNIDNLLYVLAGIEGQIFVCNGVQATQIGQIPSSIASLEGGLYLEYYPGAIVNYKNKPFFGVSVGGTDNIAGMGVWSINPSSRGNVLNHEHTISTGNDGSGEVVKVGALLGITRDALLVGWRDASTYGVDKTTTTSRYTTYTGYLESPLYAVGTNLNKRDFTQLEFQLANDLATNEGIKIEYRTALSDSFTTIGTYDFSGLGAVMSHNVKADIPSCEFIQLKISLTGTTTTPQLRSVTLR